MNRNRLLMIGLVAIALGGFVSLMVYRNLQARAASAAAPGVDVLIAANDLQLGAKIEDKDVKVVRLPPSDLPPGYLHAKSQAAGHGVIAAMSKGEFVLPNKLAGQNVGYGLPSLIPPGMRAVSVRVNEVVSVAGFVQPGTRVDVLMTGSPTSSNEQQATTVLENVAVLAAGSRLERNAAGEPGMVPVITLAVSPDDAQKLTLASSQGHIQLALRNPVDTKQEQLGSVGTNSLYKNISATVPTTPKPKAMKHIMTEKGPPPPPPFSVEVIRGDKKEEHSFPNQ